jgi:hypothetical protein
MSRSSRFVALVVLAASLALAASRAVAAPPREELQARPAQSAATLWDLWGWLRALLAPVWSKEGCSIDPHGTCIAGSVQMTPARPKGDNGFSIDPDGRRIRATVHRAPLSPLGDNGCSIDPHGAGCVGFR